MSCVCVFVLFFKKEEALQNSKVVSWSLQFKQMVLFSYGGVLESLVLDQTSAAS